MTLEDAVTYYSKIAKECRLNARIESNDYMDMKDCAYEAEQLADWLNELIVLRERIEDLISRRAAMDDLISRQAAMDDLISRQAAMDDLISRQAAMDDLISRQAAIDDLISRQAAIDAVSEGCQEWRGIFERCKENLLALPSAQPRRKMGKWISLDDFRGKYNDYGYKCSECNEQCDYDENFCPNCGAEMLKGEKECLETK